MQAKLEALRALIESQQLARYLALYTSPEHRETQAAHDANTRIKMGRKYANIDVGQSGKYMVELSTGNIYGIKAYGVIHRGHFYGTLDTINEYDWSDYTATRKQQQAA